MQTFQKTLLSWYRKQARKHLPWRKTKNPYAIWVSEAMLQQTQVETVIPYYERFLKRFPDLRSLSNSPLTEVLDCWSGLGYYSRAKNLHAGAQKVLQEYGGKIPSEAGELIKLPGIGRYTAGAIASMAYDRPEPVLDGNVIRVFSRYFGIRENPWAGPTQRKLWEISERLVPKKTPGDFNQALMDLGATVCTPRNPRCSDCPLASGCRACRQGWQNEIPPPRPSSARRRILYLCGILEKEGRVLLGRRPVEGLLPGLWEFPGGEQLARKSQIDSLKQTLQERLGISVEPVRREAAVWQTLSHRELEIRAFRCRWNHGCLQPRWYIQTRWTPVEKLQGTAFTAGMRKLADELYLSRNR